MVRQIPRAAGNVSLRLQISYVRQLLGDGLGVKLLLYSHFFPPSIGGVETIVLSLARGLAEVRSSQGLPEFELTLATQTPAESFDDHLLPFQVLRQPNIMQLWRLIRLSEIVHVAGPALCPVALGLLARKPVVVEHHGFQVICPTGQLLLEPAQNPCPGHFMAERHLECLRCRSDADWLASFKLWILTFVRRALCACVDANIVPTQWLGHLLKLPKTVPIPHGIEITAESTRAPNLSRPPVIVFQGRLVTTKGVRVLLEAANILHSASRRFELIVIGDGPERDALEQLTQDLQLSPFVRFVGRLNGVDLESVFLSATVVVVPSLGGEVFGLVLAENMSRGLPIVASSLGAFAEVLGNSGLTFGVGDAKHLARQLALVLDDPAMATSLGLRAKQRVAEAYLRNRMIEAHTQLYRQLIGSWNR
jgi:glycosyltransferase involved in cell wall biosynthesis